MESIVDPKDFPASKKRTYLDAANAALMYQGAEKAIIGWQKDLADEDIAVGSRATELISSFGWAVAPESETNVVSMDIVFPSTVYPCLRVDRHTSCEVRLAKGQNSYASPDDVIQLVDNRIEEIL
ncbi:MAG: hypothetical protein P8075_07520 [Deltaproteobacteria bacterium]|jgi:selenocysteine lyase/cysteine desulfurase